MFPYAEAEDPVGWGDVTLALLLANGLVFLVQLTQLLCSNAELVQRFAFIPAEPAPHRWLTAQFLHGGLWHLLGNLWALSIFGHRVEKRLGLAFLPFYLAGGVCANLVMWLADPRSLVPCIGASGAIAAVLGLYVALYPRARLKFWQPFAVLPSTYTLSALVFGAIYLWSESGSFASDPQAKASHVAHGAHLGGLLFGIAAGLALRGRSAERAIGGGPIASALAQGRHADALETYRAGLRAFKRPAMSAAQALALGDALAGAGRWPLARAALEELIEAEPAGASTPPALMLLGEVLDNGLKQRGPAAATFARAAAHPAADPALRDDALQRHARLSQALAAPMSLNALPADPCWLFLDDEKPLPEDLRDRADRLLLQAGLSIKSAAGGILAVNEPAAKAVPAVAALRGAGIAALAAPSDWSKLAPARAIASLAASDEGISMGSEGELPWSACWLVAAYEVWLPRMVRKGPGVLEVNFQADHAPDTLAGMFTQPTQAVEETAPRLAIEIVAQGGGRRWRWLAADEQPPEEEARRLWRAIAVEIAYAGVGCVNDGVAAAATGAELPPHLRFRWAAEAELYAVWQCLRARLASTNAGRR